MISAPMPMDGQAVKLLSLSELIARMDTVRRKAVLERYPHLADLSSRVMLEHGSVAELLDTVLAKKLDEKQRRRLADTSFRFLVQLDMLLAAGGISNTILQPSDWSSPKFCINAAALGQYQIIAGRICVECFLDLIHVVDTGDRLPSKSGKFKAFRKWIIKKDNRFKCFVGHILEVFKHDRELRQPEVHGTSRYVHQLLQLLPPTTDEINIPNRITNVVLNMWPTLLTVMNETQPDSLSVFPSGEEFANRYFASPRDESALDEFLDKALAGLEG